MTLLIFTELQHQKMRVLLQVYTFLLPLIPGCVWYFLDHFKGPDVVLSSCLEFAGPRGAERCCVTHSHAVTGQRENGPAQQNGLLLETVSGRRAGASDSPLGLAEDEELPFSQLTPGAGTRASIHGNVAPFIYP